MGTELKGKASISSSKHAGLLIPALLDQDAGFDSWLYRSGSKIIDNSRDDIQLHGVLAMITYSRPTGHRK